ncbi:MAG: aminopeptidase [Pseudomonadales bacterium]
MACGATLRKQLAVSLRPILCLALAILLGGCESIAYYRQAVAGHLALLHRAKPIEAILAGELHIDAGVDPQAGDASASQLRTRLAMVQDIRTFAREQLQLPVGRAYSRYVALQRDFVVWNVYAAGEFSTRPEQWCFPVAGCVGYRGYFAQDAAKSKAAALAARGYDTHVAGVAAYSTLGWTADPVLSTFLARDDLSLAALLFHELSHRLVYVRGDTEFNESIASTVEAFALQQWIAHRAALDDDGDMQAQLQQPLQQHLQQHLQQQLIQLQQRRALHARFVEAVAQTRADLEALYTSPLSIAEKRLEKAQRYNALAAQIRLIYSGTGAAEAYSAWASSLNNAKLLPVALYSRWQPALDWKLQQTLQAASCTTSATMVTDTSAGKDNGDDNKRTELANDSCRRGLQDFYAAIKQLAMQPAAARRLRLEAWEQEALSDAPYDANESSTARTVEARTTAQGKLPLPDTEQNHANIRAS